MRILAVFCICLLLSSITSAGAATTHSRQYVSSPHPELSLCQNGCDLDGDGGMFVSTSFGRADFAFPDGVNDLLVGVSDDLMGASAPLTVCLWDSSQGIRGCQDGDAVILGPGCSGGAVIGSFFAGDRVSVWIHTDYLRDDLTTCFATTGAISVDAF